jgi:hypothetical protein
MKTFVKSLTLMMACLAFASANAKGQTNQISTNAVTELIEKLVSPVPPKYQSGESDLTNTLEDINGFIHPNVEKARQHLIEMGTDIYPILAEHINDKRYSYSIVSAAWLNRSVGQMIEDIMAEGIEPHLGGYKWRKTQQGATGYLRCPIWSEKPADMKSMRFMQKAILKLNFAMNMFAGEWQKNALMVLLIRPRNKKSLVDIWSC